MNNFSHGNGQVTSKTFGYIVTGGMQVLTPSATAWPMRDMGLAQEFLARGNLHEHFWRKKKSLTFFYLLYLLQAPVRWALGTFLRSSVPHCFWFCPFFKGTVHDPFPLHLGKEEVFPSQRSITTLHSILGKKKNTFLRVISSLHHRQNMF